MQQMDKQKHKELADSTLITKPYQTPGFILTGDKWEDFARQLIWTEQNFLPTHTEHFRSGSIIYY